MKKFSGWEYLLIDLANQFGLDKLVFEERIQWATDNLGQLEALAEQAETQPLYHKAMQAVLAWLKSPLIVPISRLTVPGLTTANLASRHF